MPQAPHWGAFPRVVRVAAERSVTTRRCQQGLRIPEPVRVLGVEIHSYARNQGNAMMRRTQNGLQEAAARLEAGEVRVALDLAALWPQRGDVDRAAAGYRDSVRIRSAVLGPDHPELATTLVNLAQLEHARGNPAMAMEAVRRAIQLLEPAVPKDHPTLSAAYELAMTH